MYRYAVVAIVTSMLFFNYSYAQQKSGGKKKKARISQGTLKVGDEAPDFTAVKLEAISVKAKANISEKDIGAGGKVTLSSLKGKQPIVVFFSSYT